MLNLCWLLNWKLTPDPIPKGENYSYQNKSLIKTAKNQTEKKSTQCEQEEQTKYSDKLYIVLEWNVHVGKKMLFATSIHISNKNIKNKKLLSL